MQEQSGPGKCPPPPFSGLQESGSLVVVLLRRIELVCLGCKTQDILDKRSLMQMFSTVDYVDLSKSDVNCLRFPLV